jgi:pyruvate dehydrogenase E1 component
VESKQKAEEEFMAEMADLDPVETSEWVDSLRAVLHHHGSARATYLLERLTDEAHYAGATRPFALNTPYVNTIPPEREERASWDRDIEHRIRSIIRWNAVAIILRANKESSELGGISPVFNRRRRFTTSASAISGAHRPRSMAAT